MKDLTKFTVFLLSLWHSINAENTSTDYGEGTNLYVYGEGTENNGCALVPDTDGRSERDKLLKKIKEKHLFGMSFTYTDGDITYKIAICADVDPSLSQATIIRIIESQNKKEVIAFRNMTDLSGSDAWTVLNLIGPKQENAGHKCKINATLTSLVMVRCDKDAAKGIFSLLYQEADTCRYVFDLRTNLLCDVHHGMGGWSIFFLILFLGFLIYFAAGFLYLRCHVGAKGAEQIPHRVFWFRVGNILADGCGAVCRCDQYCGNVSEGSIHSDYSPIGGTTSPTLLARGAEPDTALLNP